MFTALQEYSIPKYLSKSVNFYLATTIVFSKLLVYPNLESDGF